MRKLFTVLIAVLLTATVWAQTPQKMSYQAVIRNSSDVLVTNTQIGMEINIRQGTPSGTVVYTETQTPTTNANGLLSIEIGGGTGFNTIDWSAGSYFIETKTAVAPPLTTYTITGTSQLLSVPYALHAKTADNGITTQQASDITANNAKVGITTAQADAITANTAKVGITTQQASDITSNNAKVGITIAQADAITANTLKVGITTQQASDITANNAKVGITTAQADAIEANTLKIGYTDALVSANADVVANTAKVGITTAQADAITANTAKVGITTAQADAITANTLKVGITTQQASDITANNAKVGITTAQADAITANTLKVGITTQQASDITANNAKVGITTAQADAIAANTLKIGYTDALVSANADVVANTAKVGITTAQADAITANTAKVGITTAQADAITANTAKVSAATGTATGDMQYWNGSTWVTVTVGTTGQLLSVNASGIPEWQNPSSLKSASTQAPTMTAAGVTFNGMLNANGYSTSVAFEYGTTTSYGATVVATQSPVSGTTNTAVTSAQITSLVVGTTYHVRMITQNIFGTFYGDDIEFTYLYYGASYEGGLVFSIDNSGKHGLVCATTDQSIGVNWSAAFTACADNIGGYNDWYLPSKSTLNLMYVNIKMQGFGGFASNNYWSSSEGNATNAWRQYFGNGYQSSSNKNAPYYVRAVRAF